MKPKATMLAFDFNLWNESAFSAVSKVGFGYRCQEYICFISHCVFSGHYGPSYNRISLWKKVDTDGTGAFKRLKVAD